MCNSYNVKKWNDPYILIMNETYEFFFYDARIFIQARKLYHTMSGSQYFYWYVQAQKYKQSFACDEKRILKLKNRLSYKMSKVEM